MQCIIKRKINRIAKYFNLNRRLRALGSTHDLRVVRFYDPYGIEVLTKRHLLPNFFLAWPRAALLLFLLLWPLAGRIKWTL